MTIKELYKAAKMAGIENYKIVRYEYEAFGKKHEAGELKGKDVIIRDQRKEVWL